MEDSPALRAHLFTVGLGYRFQVDQEQMREIQSHGSAKAYRRKVSPRRQIYQSRKKEDLGFRPTARLSLKAPFGARRCRHRPFPFTSDGNLRTAKYGRPDRIIHSQGRTRQARTADGNRLTNKEVHTPQAAVFAARPEYLRFLPLPFRIGGKPALGHPLALLEQLFDRP